MKKIFESSNGIRLIDKIIIGKIYKDINGAMFIAMKKDEFSVYDCTGFCYNPSNLKLIK